MGFFVMLPSLCMSEKISIRWYSFIKRGNWHKWKLIPFFVRNSSAFPHIALLLAKDFLGSGRKEESLVWNFQATSSSFISTCTDHFLFQAMQLCFIIIIILLWHLYPVWKCIKEKRLISRFGVSPLESGTGILSWLLISRVNLSRLLTEQLPLTI